MENAPNTTKQSWFKRHKILSTIGGVILLFVILSAIGGNPDVQESVQTAEVDRDEAQVATLSVSAVELSEAYDANTVAADSEYKDKIVEINGVVDTIGKDILDDPYITLEGRINSLFGVQCMFSKGSQEQLATISSGQEITLKGRVSGELIGNVLVKGCSIVS